jgi:hypothetical protein
MVSSRKPLRLDVAAGPSTRTRATSRETAADTPAETATLQGEREEDGADSDAGSSHGDPDAEALGRESNDEREIDAQVRANLESENATLLKRVKALEEHNQLLERIRQLQEEHNTIADRTRPSSTASSQPSSRGPRFDKHTLEYRGKNTQELRQWIRSLEDDHKTFPEIFDSDRKRVYYASRALKPDTQAYKHWMSKRDAEDLDSITWKAFVDTMYDALGSKEARVAQAYYSHQEAKWDPKRWSIVDFYRHLKSLEDSFLAPMEENYLYYQLWRQVPEDFRERLIGTNRPKTRDEIVKAIEQLETDRKRDRSKSNAAIQSENKRFKPDDKQRHANQEKKHDGNTKHKGNDNAGHPHDKSKEKEKEKWCGYCKTNTHMEKVCFRKNAKEKEKEDSSDSRNRGKNVRIAGVDNSGKEKAPMTPPNHRRKDQ